MDPGVSTPLRPFPLVPQVWDYTCGAACLRSALLLLRGESPSEGELAKTLGTFDVGYTPPENVVALAESFGFRCEMTTDNQLPELSRAFETWKALIVTWWDDEAGHYSLVMNLTNEKILLMDPWTARDGHANELSLSDFLVRWRQRGARLIGMS